MRMPGILSARVRGFRVVNLLGLTLLLVIALGSYALKTLAGAQDAGTVGIEDQIQQEQKRIRMLDAEISRLGAPRRVADLSRRYLNLGPADPKRVIAAEALPAALAQAAPPPAAPVAAAPTAAPAAPGKTGPAAR